MAPEPSTARELVQVPVESMRTTGLISHTQSHISLCICPIIFTHLFSNSEFACSDSNCSNRYYRSDSGVYIPAPAHGSMHAWHLSLCGKHGSSKSYAKAGMLVTLARKKSLPCSIIDTTRIVHNTFHATESERTAAVFSLNRCFVSSLNSCSIVFLKNSSAACSSLPLSTTDT